MAEDTRPLPDIQEKRKSREKTDAEIQAKAMGTAIGKVAAEKIGNATAQAMKSVTSRVIQPIVNTAMMEQLPLLQGAFSTVTGIFDDVKAAFMEDTKSKMEQKNADRIGMIADNTGETTEELDELGEILETIGESIYEGVYQGVQDGIANLVGEFFDGVGAGFKDVMEEQGIKDLDGFKAAIGQLVQDFRPTEDDDGFEDDLLDSIWRMETYLEDMIEALGGVDDKERRREREDAMERRAKGSLFEVIPKEKEGRGLLGNLEKLLQLTALRSVFAGLAGIIGGVVAFLAGPIMGAVKLLAAGVTALFTPVGLIIAGIAAVTAAFVYVAHKLGDGDIIEGFKKMGTMLWNFISEIPGKIMDTIRDIPGEIMALMKDPIPTIKRWGREIKDALLSPINSLREFFSEELGAIDKFLTDTGIKDKVMYYWNVAMAHIHDFIRSFVQPINMFMEDVQSLWDKFTGKIKEMVSFITAIPDQIGKWIVDNVPDWALPNDLKARYRQPVTQGDPETAKAILNFFKDKSFMEGMQESVAAGVKPLSSELQMISKQGLQEHQSAKLKDELSKLTKAIEEQNQPNIVSNVVQTINNAASMAQTIFPKGFGVKPDRPTFGY